MAPPISSKTPRPVTPPKPAAVPEKGIVETASEKVTKAVDTLVGAALATLPGQKLALSNQLRAAKVPAAQADLIMKRLDAMPEDVAKREVALLAKALSVPGGNGDRVANAYLAISDVAKASPSTAARLTPEVKAALLEGVARPRTADALGQAGVLGVKQAREAAEAIVRMPPGHAKQLEQLLARAGTGSVASPRADARTEQALVLKALAARSDRFDPSRDAILGAEGMRDVAMIELKSFADEIRGMPRSGLVASTTAIDVDGSVNTSRTSGENLTRPGTDTAANNDGLFQHHQTTCAPTTGQMMRAEADPIYARRLHQGGLDNVSWSNDVTKEQSDVLKKFNGQGYDRLYQQQRFVERDGYVATAKAAGASDAETAALAKYFTFPDLTQSELMLAGAALGRMAGRPGAPTQTQALALRQFATTPLAGTDMLGVVNDMVSGSTHQKYKWVNTDTGATSPQTLMKRFDDVAAAVRAGHDVPVFIGPRGGGSGHVGLITDVRGEGVNAQFRYSDPMTGRTEWVKATDWAKADPSWQINGFGLKE